MGHLSICWALWTNYIYSVSCNCVWVNYHDITVIWGDLCYFLSSGITLWLWCKIESQDYFCLRVVFYYIQSQELPYCKQCNLYLLVCVKYKNSGNVHDIAVTWGDLCYYSSSYITLWLRCTIETHNYFWLRGVFCYYIQSEELPIWKAV